MYSTRKKLSSAGVFLFFIYYVAIATKKKEERVYTIYENKKPRYARRKRGKNMKKIVSLLLVLVLLSATLISCDKGEPTVVRLGGMTGPTSIGMVKLLESDKAGTSANDYDFTLATSGDEIKTALLQGDLDIAAIPANLASALYNATGGKIKLLAINTLGVVSILEKGSAVNTLSDLAGKTVYAPATAKGAIPELVFNYLLRENGVENVTVEWVDATELAKKLKTEAGAVVLSPEPNASAILTNVEGSRRAIDLNEAWGALENGAEYITGVVVARTDFIEKNPEAVDKFLKEYGVSVAYVNAANAEEIAKLVTEHKILAVSEAIVERAIPTCNIAYIDGEEMKTAMSGFIDLLFDGSPKAFGGKKPDDAFYYVKK